jgi:ATP-dependent DNA ligase
MARTNRELVMLAETYERGKHRVAGMFMSEKLDGMRCLWVPETRGIPIRGIPFANREKDKREHVATGLWTRYGKVIHCPDYFTASFPPILLDGELYMGRGRFQEVMSTCKTLEPDEHKWHSVHFKVFESPAYSCLFQSGKINNPQWTKFIKLEQMEEAFGRPFTDKQLDFEIIYNWLKRQLVATEYMSLHEQRLLPFNTPIAQQIVDEELERVTLDDGEGLMLRHPASPYEPIRSRHLLKVKKLLDAEGTIIDFKAGEFGKDGKLLGLMGSAVVQWEHGTFNLSGFTDAERGLEPDASVWALSHPGELLSQSPAAHPSRVFRVGERITFVYRELTDDRQPKEGRFKRKAT